MRKTQRFANAITALSLWVALFGFTPVSVRAEEKEPKADPRLLQLAEENPDATFMIIIQRERKNRDPEDDPEIALEKAGGTVQKHLDISDIWDE